MDNKIQLVKDSSKAQVAIEFLVYTGIFIFILVIAFVSISYIQTSELPARQGSLVKENGEEFASVINLAVKSGQGFRSSYTFPKTILDKNYELTFDSANSRFIMTWGDTSSQFSYVYPIIRYNYQINTCISRNFNKISSNTCSNTINIHNDGDTLFIDQE